MIEQLSKHFKLKNYRLKLDIDSDQLTFRGTVTITGAPAETTDTLKFHSKDLTIANAHIDGKQAKVSLSPDEDLVILQADAALDTKEVAAVIDFSGTITESMHGMYPCYFEHGGKRKKLIATQFESHHAREVFPCIDEPAAKATFDVELVTNEGETVLSNMPVKKQQIDSSKQITEFETTPVMSTYLLAFVAGEMVSKESKTKDGVIVRSWASAAQDPSLLDYSVKEAAALIEFYNDYFDIPYPLRKCDQVALPDFDSGAMENWGLITYRETVLLVDPANKSISSEQLSSEVIAHELSHQWFGNLVTMQWWDDLWLNESFANMMATLAIDKLHPQWKSWEEYVAYDGAAATNRDVYTDVQSVKVTVDNPSEINTLFDPAIVYAKGGKLLKMLLDMLGEDAWRAGLKDYFTAHAHQNTTRDDLWDALSAHTNVDIAGLMNGWIGQPGQPLITVTQDGAKLSLEQQRLLLDGSDEKTVWQVPLLSKQVPEIFSEKLARIDLAAPDWIMLNSSGMGHYITNYTAPEHKTWLGEQLALETTDTPWKINRLNELIMLARHGSSSLSEALETIIHCQNESRAMVWSSIGSIIGNAHMLTSQNDEARQLLKKLSGNLAESNFEKLGWDYQEDEDSNKTHLRTIMLGMMISSERYDIIQHALQQYREISNPELLPAESRNKILAVVAKFGTPDEFQSLVKIYKSTQNADFRADLCSALTATKSEEHIAQLLEMMLDTKVVRSQDLIRWYIFLLRNRHARQATWQWLKDNWSWIMERFDGGKSCDDFARYTANIFATEEMMQEYINFFSPMKDDPALKRAITVGTEELKARLAWKQRDEAAITAWLTQYFQ